MSQRKHVHSLQSFRFADPPRYICRDAKCGLDVDIHGLTPALSKRIRPTSTVESARRLAADLKAAAK